MAEAIAVVPFNVQHQTSGSISCFRAEGCDKGS